MRLETFRPRDAIRILLDRKTPVFRKTWALARLMTWIALDQRRGRRKPKKQPSARSNQPRFRKRNARMAGHFALSSLLARGQRSRQRLGMLKLFLASGGFQLFLEGPRSANGWLSRLKDAREDLSYPYEITSYLCRHKTYGTDVRKFTIQCAKLFIADRDAKSTVRSISEKWETLKQAAPYIFAFFQFFSDAVTKAETVHDLVDRLEKLSSDQGRLDRLLGNAAYIADILSEGRVRDVRTKDFKTVTRRKPKVAPFSSSEISIIEAIDPNRLSAADIRSYKPKVRPMPADSNMPAANPARRTVAIRHSVCHCGLGERQMAPQFIHSHASDVIAFRI